jgi:hypothetical protein
VLTDLNNNQDPVSDMVAYQAECEKELGFLEQENQDLLVSLQGNSSPANWSTVSGEIQTNLQQMQVIINQEAALQGLAAAKANNNAQGFNGVGQPSPTPAPTPSPTPAPTPAPTPTPTPTPAPPPPPSGQELNTDNTPGPSSPGPGPIPVGSVQFDPNGFNNGQTAFLGYLNQALDALGITNPTARQNWIKGYLVAGNRESSFQSGAVNQSDGFFPGAPTESDGALAGSSRGFVQVSPGTFAEFHQPGTSDNIYNPVANISASINYVMARYGVSKDGSNLGIVQQFNANDAPHGY